MVTAVQRMPCWPAQSSPIHTSVEKSLTLLDDNGLKVCILADKTLQVTDDERRIHVGGLDQLGKQTIELLRQDQQRSVDLDKQLHRISQIGVVQTSLGVFSSAIGVAAGIATGGAAGLLIAAGALLTGAHQIVSRADGYHALASQLTNDTQKQEELGQAFHTYVGYLTLANTLMNLAMGGTDLVKKGFEKATEANMRGASDVTSFGQYLANMTQTNLEAKRAVLQVEGQKINIELTDNDYKRNEHNTAIGNSHKVEELAFDGVMAQDRIKRKTSEKIIRGR